MQKMQPISALITLFTDLVQTANIRNVKSGNKDGGHQTYTDNQNISNSDDVWLNIFTSEYYEVEHWAMKTMDIGQIQ